ncbi:hypothetical protein [Listeria booriae]|uniref:Uncharacterized protein n=1 Tax=Listeria booriae TaxID=1552123 RepID=A0A7X0TKX6_9LIST|nr:hypothetical protein [Listeria booriae]MBC1286938.1 hypothetical protein [Listeria booriae]MBC1331090.1 hypothetical protein [Listeria booriae]MBC2386400.1 hypothetical protein [Listeria booriae]
MSKFTEEQLISVWRENGFAVGNDDWQDVTLVDETEWDDFGKGATMSVVFSFKKKYYIFSVDRYGSYYQGYEYFVEEDAVEVDLKTETKTIEVRSWVPVEEAE